MVMVMRGERVGNHAKLCAAVRIEKRQTSKTRPRWSGENFRVPMGAGVVPPLLSMASSKIRTEVREHVSENGLGKLWSEQKRCEKKKRERG